MTVTATLTTKAPRASVTLSKEQTKALDVLEDDQTKRLVFGGQAGGGKSFLICLWQITQRITYPGTRGYIGREVLKTLKNSILVTFFDVVKLLNVPIRYNDNKGYIDFNNGSRIVLLDLFNYPSDPNWDALGSTEYTDGAIEEGVQVSQKAADLLISRTRYKHTDYNLTPKQLITCNPGPGWVRETIVIPQLETTPPAGSCFISASLDSNPNKAFVDAYKATLEGLTDQYDKARLLYGDWYAAPKTGGEFYKDFTVDANTKAVYYDPDAPLHISFDFNVNPYMTATIHQLTGGRSWQIDEITLKTPRNTTRHICQEIKTRYANHSAGVFIYGDPSGKAQDTRSEKGHNDYSVIMGELADYQPTQRVSSKAPSVVMRGRFINSVFAGRIEGLEIVIGDQCKETIADYTQVKEAADGTKVKAKAKDPKTGVTYEKYGHTSDANDYYIISIFAAEYRDYITGPRVPVYSMAPTIKRQKF